MTVTAVLDDDVRGEARVTVVPGDAGLGPDRSVYTDHEGLDEALAADGVAVVDDPGAADVALVTRLDDATREAVERGGAAVLLPGSVGRGRLAACTLRVADAYGSHPVAAVALAALVDELLG